MAVAAGHRIAQRAWRKLRRHQISIELLVTVAIAGALLLGEFLEAVAAAALFLLGERLEARALGRTRVRSPDWWTCCPKKRPS
jgi:Cd2+/Zn2+-exporting ATPase